MLLPHPLSSLEANSHPIFILLAANDQDEAFHWHRRYRCIFTCLSTMPRSVDVGVR